MYLSLISLRILHETVSVCDEDAVALLRYTVCLFPHGMKS